jgi:uncharacterized membrane protein YeiH
MDEAVTDAVEIPRWIDLLAVFAGALAGSLLATKRDFDIIGIFVLAIVGGLGGGLIRDVLIQRGTPAALDHSSYLIAAFAAGAVGFFFAQQVARVSWAMAGIDAVSLGLYTLVGALVGLKADLPALSVILLGVVTAAGGGLLRDVLLAQTPQILLPGTPYAVLSGIGALMVVILDQFYAAEAWLYWLPVALVVFLRFVALYLGWQTPLATDLPARMQDMVATTPISAQLKGVNPSRLIRRQPRRGTGGRPEPERPDNGDSGQDH